MIYDPFCTYGELIGAFNPPYVSPTYHRSHSRHSFATTNEQRREDEIYCWQTTGYVLLCITDHRHSF